MYAADAPVPPTSLNFEPVQVAYWLVPSPICLDPRPQMKIMLYFTWGIAF